MGAPRIRIDSAPASAANITSSFNVRHQVLKGLQTKQPLVQEKGLVSAIQLPEFNGACGRLIAIRNLLHTLLDWPEFGQLSSPLTIWQKISIGPIARQRDVQAQLWSRYVNQSLRGDRGKTLGGIHGISESIDTTSPWYITATSVLKKVTRIITFFKKAKLQLARLRAYQLECYGKQKAFITPAITRWGTQLGAVMSSLANKDALRAYARDAMVLNSLKAKAIKGEEEEEEDRQVLRAILSSINNFEFWHEVEMLAKILRLIENAQRCSERDHSCVGQVIPRWLIIQSKWDALEEANQDPLINYSELRQWRVQRMKDQTTDIHHFAFALDPRTTIGEGLGLDTMERAHRFPEENTSNEECQQLFGEFCRFRAREGALFGPTSRIYREQPKTPHTPSHYYVLSAWGYFGSMGVKLATLARRVLGSLANSVPSERSFSATNYLHCKLRNRLSPLSTDKVTFIYMNSRVLYGSTQSQTGWG
ncbi:hypothetical protein ACJZ2D_017000 [Fusarium nematophilum]